MKTFLNIRLIVLFLVLGGLTFNLKAEGTPQSEPTPAPSYLLIKERPELGLVLDSFLKASDVKTLYSFGDKQPTRILEIPGTLNTGELLARLQAAALISESAVDITVANTGLELLMKNFDTVSKTPVVASGNDSVETGIPVLLELKPGTSLAASAQMIADCGGKFVRAFGEQGQFQIVELSRGADNFGQMVSYLGNALVQTALPAVSEASNMFSGISPDRLIVEFKPGTTPEQISGFGRSVGAGSVAPIYPGSNRYRVRLASDSSLTDLYGKVERSGLVDKVEPAMTWQYHVLPNDPLFSELWAFKNTGQAGGVAGVDMGGDRGWSLGVDSSSIIIADIDTGFNINHEDLSANLWVNTQEVPGDGIDNDANGYIDDVNGIYPEEMTGDVSDTIGHGTMTLGCIAASGNNGLGVVGSNWKARVMLLKLGAVISDDNVIACIDYAIQNGAKVINCSFGGPVRSMAVEAKIKEAKDAGIIVVASAGNGGGMLEPTANNDRYPQFPANYTVDNVVSVGAINRFGQPAFFTNYGTSVAISAPGEEILTTEMSANDSYAVVDGTSFSAPYTTGIFGLATAIYSEDGYFRTIERVLARAKVIDTLPDNANARKGIPDLGAVLFDALPRLNPVETYTSTDVPARIPVVGTGTATVRVTKGGVIASLRLTLDVTHTYPRDCYMEVEAPSGKVFTYQINGLSVRGEPRGGQPWKFDKFPIWLFTGDSALGDWKVRIIDEADLDSGAITNFKLDVVTYVNPPGPGTFWTEYPEYSVLESGKFVTVGVKRAAGNLGTISVEYDIVSGTAKVGKDVERVNGRLIFEPGELYKTVNIPIIDDDEIEGDEYFTFLLKNPGGTTISRDKAKIQISKNDLGFFNFTAANYSVSEGQGSITVTVTRDSYLDTPAAVYFSTVGGSADPGTAFSGGDYTPMQGWMLFPSGVTSQTVTIPISNDGQPEMPESFKVKLSNPTQGSSLGPQSQTTITIND